MNLSTVFHALSTLLLVTNLARAEMYDMFDVFDEISDRLECPDIYQFVEENPDYTIECVENSIPPWPLCLFHNITYFVAASVSSASRCCDFENLDECRCPLKNYDKWQMKMDNWCENIATCPTEIRVDGTLSTDAWTTMMMEDDGN
eukprot:163191_1